MDRFGSLGWYLRLSLFVFFAVLLTSCTHVSRKDGPPNFYVNETKIPNAVPKAERLSKYGNMKSYRVFGKTYYPMKSSKNYDQIGVASWYGTKFHAQRTSSGERYNMLAMTAAHKTLPLPTYVEVTNLKNQRKIIVKVNDRGPFLSNRIIDLSYVAAKKLDIVGHGTAHVRVQAIDPYRYARDRFYLARNKFRSMFARNNTRYQHKQVYLHVASFNQRVHAENLKNRLNHLIHSPIKIASVKRRPRNYAVHIGPIKDVATAEKITNQLKQLGLKPRSFK
jgi:peptidoglycan lytic transglycosylase